MERERGEREGVTERDRETETSDTGSLVGRTNSSDSIYPLYNVT